jgi:hypothetical protein
MKLLTIVLLLASLAWCQQLPDAPGVTREQTAQLDPNQESNALLPGTTKANLGTAAKTEHRPVADRAFWTSTGILFAVTVANVQVSHSCLEAQSCTLEQLPSKSTGGMYAVALPIDAGVAFLGYKLKQHSHRWWWVPAAALTAAQTYSLIHAARQLSNQ